MRNHYTLCKMWQNLGCQFYYQLHGDDGGHCTQYLKLSNPCITYAGISTYMILTQGRR